MPPASAKAIASLICRRSKYFSRIRTHGTIGAQLARPVVVLGAESKILSADSRDGGQDALLGQRVVGGDVVQLSPPQVIEDQPGLSSTRQQSPAGGQAVDAELKRVRRKQLRIERRVGLEIDQ